MSEDLGRSLRRLQRMETSAIRAHIAFPDAIGESSYQQLRYVIGFARLHRFSPGRAAYGVGRGDIELDPMILVPVRERVIAELYRPLCKEEDLKRRLSESAAVLGALHEQVGQARAALLRQARGLFSEPELDAEVGKKALVTIAGGGGGAGYVYIGAAARLRQEGLSSDYIVGASIGALIGAFLSRSRQVDLPALLSWAKGLSLRSIFSQPYVGATHTLPGLMRLHLRAMHQEMLDQDGQALRLADLEIPYEAVIAGVKTRAYEHLPETAREFVSIRDQRKRFSRLVAERMQMLGTFINPNVVKPIVLGRDARTSSIRVVDAVGLSAAIPAILQYEPPRRDAQTDAALARLREEEQVALFVDGGVTANVPARIAWEGVHAGRIGTRNAFYLALDCFAPRFEPSHLWLWPITQIVQLQLNSQRRYFDWLVRFEPTLSPVNLLPTPADFDRAFKWGWDQAEGLLPFLKKALEPVRWAG